MTKALLSPFPLLRYVNVPVAITALGILAGMTSIYCASRHAYHGATGFMLAAILFDQLDGLVARRLGQVSTFGGYLDVFSDFISYCLFPVSVIYSLNAESLPLLAAMAALMLGARQDSCRLSHAANG